MLSTYSKQYKPMVEWLRENCGISHPKPLSLWSLPDPPPNMAPIMPYEMLIALAIYGSENKRLTLLEIYNAIEDRFLYYRMQPEEPGRDGNGGGKRWQRAARHTLYGSTIFASEPPSMREPGKGSHWSLRDKVAIDGDELDSDVELY
ncbi:hypothetical protein H0H92_013364 [Tricholoma furcatifolium]|nr:hypothetical protein H0H92_013364 [Tricholoma furcatifolium]